MDRRFLALVAAAFVLTFGMTWFLLAPAAAVPATVATAPPPAAVPSATAVDPAVEVSPPPAPAYEPPPNPNVVRRLG